MVDEAEIGRLARSNDVERRKKAAEELKNNFAFLSDKERAWADLFLLTVDKDDDVRLQATSLLGSVIPYLPDKIRAWDYIHHLVKNEDRYLRRGVAVALGSAFPHIPNKKQAWDDVRWLIRDKDRYVRWCVAGILGSVFSYIPDKDEAWADVILLTQDKDDGVRLRAASILGSFFPHILNKKYPYIDLQRLTQDRDSFVRAISNHSLGKASIFKATEAKNEEIFRDELEKALKFFEIASKEETFINNPASFCLPFYRSFYTLTFKNEETEVEVQKYIAEAKISVKGSESKEKLLKAVENLGNALKEANKIQDFNDMKSDLNAYRRYCDRACELLDTMEEKAPGASRLIRKGLPIIDERIKGIIAEIQEKAKTLCKETKGTAFEDLGSNVYRIGQNLLVSNPVILEKRLNNLQISLSAICARTTDINVVEACELIKRANDEPILENRIQLMDDAISKILPHVGNMTNIQISNSNNVQITTGNGNSQKMSIENPEEKTRK